MNLSDFPARSCRRNCSSAKWIFFFFILLSWSISVSLSDPRISESRLICGKSPSPLGTNMIPSFVSEMQNLAQLVNNHHFATYQFNSIYALFQCHSDLSQTDCLLCFAAARTRLPRCIPAVSGALFLDGCFLRYDNYSFYREATWPSYSGSVCNSTAANATAAPSVDFGRNVRFAVANASGIAVNSNGFGVYGANGVYALAQCWESIAEDDCRRCLATAAAAATNCVPKKEGTGMNAGCYLRYSTHMFYSNTESMDSHGEP